MFSNVDTRVGETLAAFLAIVIAISTFTAPDTSPINVMLSQVLPEWAIINIVCALFSLYATFTNRLKIVTAARFVSGCFWGSIVLTFGNAQQFLPTFWVAIVMFLFEIYLVTVKGQLWATKGNS